MTRARASGTPPAGVIVDDDRVVARAVVAERVGDLAGRALGLRRAAGAAAAAAARRKASRRAVVIAAESTSRAVRYAARDATAPRSLTGRACSCSRAVPVRAQSAPSGHKVTQPRHQDPVDDAGRRGLRRVGLRRAGRGRRPQDPVRHRRPRRHGAAQPARAEGGPVGRRAGDPQPQPRRPHDRADDAAPPVRGRQSQGAGHGLRRHRAVLSARSTPTARSTTA